MNSEGETKGVTGMAKKFGKFLVTAAAISGAVAGAYYYLKKKNEAAEVIEDDFDDFDDFSEDLEEEEAEDATGEDRSYVDLNLDKAKEALENVATDAVEKTEEFFDDEDNSNDAM